jgi:uncharacterized membrane protein
MGMHIHELHAAMVHAPLALLLTAATIDLTAALGGNRHAARLAHTLWWAGAGGALLAGVAGLASSQEVKRDDSRTSDMIWLHGIGNAGLIMGALGMAAWRRNHRPSVAQATLALLGCGVSLYTAYLGGEMVYRHGVGVRAMPAYATTGVQSSPSLLSRAAPGAFLRDALRGLRWLVSRTGEVLLGRKPVDRAAFGTTEEPRADGVPV